MKSKSGIFFTVVLGCVLVVACTACAGCIGDGYLTGIVRDDQMTGTWALSLDAKDYLSITLNSDRSAQVEVSVNGDADAYLGSWTYMDSTESGLDIYAVSSGDSTIFLGHMTGEDTCLYTDGNGSEPVSLIRVS